MAAVPGAPGSLVVARRGVGTRLELWDHAVLRYQTEAPHPIYYLEFDPNTGILYSDGAAAFQLGAANFEPIRGRNQNLTVQDLEFGGDILYTARGFRVDPRTGASLGFYGVSSGSAVEPDPRNGRVFFVSRGTVWSLMAYQPETLYPLGFTNLANLSGGPTNLMRWGMDGLAFSTLNQVFVMRSKLVPTGAPADLGLSQVLDPAPRPLGSNVSFRITVRNSGPGAATNVVVVSRFTPAATVASAVSSRGTITSGSTIVACNAGTLPAGESLELNLQLVPESLGGFTNTLATTSDSPDLKLEDNRIVTLLNIVTPDANPPALMIDGLDLDPYPGIRCVTGVGYLYSLQVSSNLVHWETVTNFWGNGALGRLPLPSFRTDSPQLFRLQRF
jgi:uncharacterized repeat protein (TIGR01451 family)